MQTTPGGKQHENYGRGVYELSDDDAFWASPAALADHVRQVVTAPDYQPPLLPAVALELVQLSSDPTTPIAKVRHLVESEPLIAVKVVQLAQSALYSRGMPVHSLDDAMTRLGLKNLSDLFLQAAMTTRVFRTKGYKEPMEGLRRHSVMCAHLARLVCRRTGFPDEYAYMCGLLHDVGTAAGILIFGDTKRKSATPKYADVQPSIESVHEEASSIVAKAWNLPPDVQLVLGHHHHFLVGARVHPLAAAVCLADCLASTVQFGAGDEVKAADGIRAAQELRLTDQDLRNLTAEAKSLAATL